MVPVRCTATLVALLASVLSLGCGTSSAGGASDPGIPPASPALVEMHAVSPGQVWLSYGGAYDPGGTVDGVTLYRNDTAIANLPNVAGEYNDRTLSPATQYCYRVTAYGPGGESTPSEALCARTLSATFIDPCWSQHACDSCITMSGCGWCHGTELCVSGSVYGPSYGWCAWISIYNPGDWSFLGGTVRLACESTTNPACDTCISSCQGLSSCCTGCGCLCETECGGYC